MESLRTDWPRLAGVFVCGTLLVLGLIYDTVIYFRERRERKRQPEPPPGMELDQFGPYLPR